MQWLLLAFLFFVQSVVSVQFLISFHGGSSGINNIYQYSITGTNNGAFLSNDDGLHGLRGMVFNGSQLLIAQAYVSNSSIFGTSDCGDTADEVTTKMLSHPYGLALDSSKQLLYITNQDTNNLIVVSLNTGAASALATVNAPRGVAFDPVSKYIFVGASGDNAVYVYSSSGKQVDSITGIDSPIGVFVNGNTLYVSSKSKSTPGVYSYSIPSLSLVQTFKTPDNHPTGITIYNGYLYVLGQQNDKLYQFRLSDGTYIGTVTSKFDDDPEQIVLSTAC